MTTRTLHANPIIPGAASGIALVSREPLSFWGGYDAATGEIIDRRHALSGQNAAGRILVVPCARGSSTTSQVLLEAVRASTAPAALITTESDFFFALASVVADELYGKPLPMVAVSEAEFAGLRTGDVITIEVNGLIRIDEM
jgi:predicted aconitase with swiveling domain